MDLQVFPRSAADHGQQSRLSSGELRCYRRFAGDGATAIPRSSSASTVAEPMLTGCSRPSSGGGAVEVLVGGASGVFSVRGIGRDGRFGGSLRGMGVNIGTLHQVAPGKSPKRDVQQAGLPLPGGCLRRSRSAAPTCKGVWAAGSSSPVLFPATIVEGRLRRYRTSRSTVRRGRAQLGGTTAAVAAMPAPPAD